MSDIFDSLIINRANGNVTYNISDLNRVETAVNELMTLLTSAGYYTNAEIKTNWQITDVPSFEQMQRYLNNVLNLENQFVQTNITLPESLEFMDYVVANNIEKILQALYGYFEQMQNQYRLCNTFKCGE